jgi:hypothetical protein
MHAHKVQKRLLQAHVEGSLIGLHGSLRVNIASKAGAEEAT